MLKVPLALVLFCYVCVSDRVLAKNQHVVVRCIRQAWDSAVYFINPVFCHIIIPLVSLFKPPPPPEGRLFVSVRVRPPPPSPARARAPAPARAWAPRELISRGYISGSAWPIYTISIPMFIIWDGIYCDDLKFDLDLFSRSRQKKSLCTRFRPNGWATGHEIYARGGPRDGQELIRFWWPWL